MRSVACAILALISLNACSPSIPRPVSPPSPSTFSDGPPTADQYAAFFTFEKIDTNHNERIELEEFLKANYTIILNNPQADTRTFNRYDANHDGFLNRQEHAPWYVEKISGYG